MNKSYGNERNEIVKYSKEILELQKLCELHNEKINKAVDEIKLLRSYIGMVQKRHRFKYKGNIYYVVIKPLKRYFSILKKDVKGNYYIFIESGLTRQERQRELHGVLKNKNFLKAFK